MGTINFSPSQKQEIEENYALQRKFGPDAPFVTTEFHSGWYLEWGQQSQKLPTDSEVVASANDMYRMGASFFFFMISGGTNFGFWSGSGHSTSVVTSFDFSTPISEAGDITSQYIALRNWISTLEDWSTPPKGIPSNTSKIAVKQIQLNYIGSADSFILNDRFARKKCISSKYPLSFEELRHPFGFVIYSTTLKFSGTDLSIESLKDFGFTSLDGEPQGVFVNKFGSTTRRSLQLKDAKMGNRLSIIVENFGREDFFIHNDIKGILSNVTLDGKLVDDWTQCGIDFKFTYNILKSLCKREQCSKLVSAKEALTKSSGQGIYFGSFTAPRKSDTFFDSTGWDKGVLNVNVENLGRYWPTMGPQVTLYVPSPIIKRRNYVFILELGTPTNCCDQSCSVDFVDHPIYKFGSSKEI